MKLLVVAMCVVLIIITAPPARAQSGRFVVRCEVCHRILGKEVPESQLSQDPDFKMNGMFQVCQHCLDKKMHRQAQANYVRIAQKYKWNSIAHNRAVAFRPLSRSVD